jgi:hypothetical protein
VAILTVDNRTVALPCAAGLAYVTDAMAPDHAPAALGGAAKRRTQPWRGGKNTRDAMAIAELSHDRVSNPVDLVEDIAARNDWAAERTSTDELTLTVAGQWTDYHVSLNWRDDLETLHIACAFDAKVPDNRLAEVYRLVAQINEQLWLGHFDVWLHEGLIMYRQGLMLNGALATPHQCEALLKAAFEACERYYQAFQFVVWAGKESREALASTMFETEGQA